MGPPGLDAKLLKGRGSNSNHRISEYPLTRSGRFMTPAEPRDRCHFSALSRGPSLSQLWPKEPEAAQKICGFRWIQRAAEDHLGHRFHQDEKQTPEERWKCHQVHKKEFCPDIK